METSVLVALIAAIGSCLAAAIGGGALILARKTHKLVNSRMDEMLALTRIAFRAEGVAAGEQSERDRSSIPVTIVANGK